MIINSPRPAQGVWMVTCVRNERSEAKSPPELPRFPVPASLMLGLDPRRQEQGKGKQVVPVWQVLAEERKLEHCW